VSGTAPRDPRLPDPRGWSPSWTIRASVGVHALASAVAIVQPASWPWSLGAVAANHAVLFAAGMVPRSRLLGPNLVRLPDEAAARGEVALTFDDGPDPDVTPRVLDLLDAHGARASFFCVGRDAAAHPAIVRDIVRRGHSVENHTQTHPYSFAAHPPAALRRQVAQCQAALEAAAGRTPRFFRAPIGLRSPLLEPVLAGMGLTLASWSRRGLDTLQRDPARVARRLIGGLQAGDIVLLHDGSSARTQGGTPVVLAVLPGLLDCLAQRGLRAVSLPAALDAPPLPAAAEHGLIRGLGEGTGLLWDGTVAP
jgi:peptidoglycan/xylan/chitin deacetylase (PgdA/CDA1 family)